MRLRLGRVLAASALVALMGCATSSPATVPSTATASPKATYTPSTVTSLPPTETSTSTPMPSPTATPTPSPTPTATPTVAQGKAKICLVLADDEPAAGSYVQVMDADERQVIPNDGSTGLEVTSRSGCCVVSLLPGSHYVRAQKVINPFEGIYATGSAEFDVVLGGTVEVLVKLVE